MVSLQSILLRNINVTKEIKAYVLVQCFSTGVSRNPGVPWASLKGSADILKESILTFVCMFSWKGGKTGPLGLSKCVC
jgi:hypothetical protein